MGGKSKDALHDQLNELKQELLSLRISKHSCKSTNKLTKIKNVRNGIARILTVIQQIQRGESKKETALNKYLPLALRSKLSRAKRAALTKSQKKLRTDKLRRINLNGLLSKHTKNKVIKIRAH